MLFLYFFTLTQILTFNQGRVYEDSLCRIELPPRWNFTPQLNVDLVEAEINRRGIQHVTFLAGFHDMQNLVGGGDYYDGPYALLQIIDDVKDIEITPFRELADFAQRNLGTSMEQVYGQPGYKEVISRFGEPTVYVDYENETFFTILFLQSGEMQRITHSIWKVYRNGFLVLHFYSSPNDYEELFPTIEKLNEKLFVKAKLTTLQRPIDYDRALNEGIGNAAGTFVLVLLISLIGWLIFSIRKSKKNKLG